MKRRKVICSITSSGLAIPPDQNESQMRSICDFNSPVIIYISMLGPTRRRLGPEIVGPYTRPSWLTL